MSLSNLSNLTAAQLNKAAAIAEKIEKLNAELAELLGSSVPAIKVPGKRGPKKGGMSAEGRAKIAAAQKARWAKVNAGKTPEAETTEKPAKKKRKMSAEARAAISAAQKARWAVKQAAKA